MGFSGNFTPSRLGDDPEVAGKKALFVEGRTDATDPPQAIHVVDAAVTVSQLTASAPSARAGPTGTVKFPDGNPPFADGDEVFLVGVAQRERRRRIRSSGTAASPSLPETFPDLAEADLDGADDDAGRRHGRPAPRGAAGKKARARTASRSTVGAGGGRFGKLFSDEARPGTRRSRPDALRELARRLVLHPRTPRRRTSGSPPGTPTSASSSITTSRSIPRRSSVATTTRPRCATSAPRASTSTRCTARGRSTSRSCTTGTPGSVRGREAAARREAARRAATRRTGRRSTTCRATTRSARSSATRATTRTSSSRSCSCCSSTSTTRSSIACSAHSRTLSCDDAVRPRRSELVRWHYQWIVDARLPAEGRRHGRWRTRCFRPGVGRRRADGPPQVLQLEGHGRSCRSSSPARRTASATAWSATTTCSTTWTGQRSRSSGLPARHAPRSADLERPPAPAARARDRWEHFFETHADARRNVSMLIDPSSPRRCAACLPSGTAARTAEPRCAASGSRLPAGRDVATKMGAPPLSDEHC